MNKVYNLTIFKGKTIRIIFGGKSQSYYVELGDLRKLFEINLKDLPEKYQKEKYYFEIKTGLVKRKLAGIAEEDLEVIKNFSRSKDADNYLASIRCKIADLKCAYGSYIRGMILSQDEVDSLICDNEKKAKKINILEGKVDEYSEAAKYYLEFTNNSVMTPLMVANKKLKYKTTYPQLLGHLRQSGAINEDCIPSSHLIEKGCFRVFSWSTKVGDKETRKTLVLVSESGIKFINEILEKSNGKGVKRP